MKSYLVLTAVGPDRRGIVEGISRFILDHRCNLEDSRMAILGGEFALIVLVSGTQASVGTVRSEFTGYVSEIGLTGTAKETASAQAGRDHGFVPFQIRAVGLDHEGIVHQIANTLHQMRANIESLDTQATSAPFTGASMFTLTMRVAVPPDVLLPSLRSKLQAVCDLVNVDVTVQPG